METKIIIENGIEYTIDIETKKAIKAVWIESGETVKYTRYNDIIFYECGFFQGSVNSWGKYEIWDTRQKGENAIMVFSGENAKLNFLNVWYIIHTFA